MLLIDVGGLGEDREALDVVAQAEIQNSFVQSREGEQFLKLFFSQSLR